MAQYLKAIACAKSIARRVFRSTVSEWLMLLCTLFLAYLAWIQSESTEKELRAYVSLTRGEILGLDDEGPLKVKLTLKNSGQTPAMDAEGGAAIMVNDFTSTPSDEELLQLKFTIGSGVESYMFQDLDPSWRSDIKSGKSVVRAVGLVRYKDVFGATHFSRFSLTHNGNPHTQSSPYMAATPTGNSSD
jgi:hypothetical protein